MNIDDNDEWAGIQLPIIKRISKNTVADDIISLTSKETSEKMKELFETFQKITGKNIVIHGEDLPVNVLMPKNEIFKKSC